MQCIPTNAIIYPLSFIIIYVLLSAIIYLLSSAIIYSLSLLAFNYQWYDNISGKSPVIIDMQLLCAVWWQLYGCDCWQPEWKVII